MDLHTHPIEALKDKLGIRGIHDINQEVASLIVRAIKSAGLQGIAITEHNNFNHGWVACLEILDHFNKENLVVLPGEEIDYGGQQWLHLYIPDYYRRRMPFFKGQEWFFILAHPGYYNPLEKEKFNPIKYDAVEAQSLHGDFPEAEGISQERQVPLVRSSDAHRLEDLGRYYTELEFK